MKTIKNTQGCLNEVTKNINGYIVKLYWKKKRGEISKVINISFPDRRSYLPEISADRDYINETYNFAIQTTSYGALNSEEFKEFLSAQQMALATIEEIKNFDWDNAVIIDFD